MMWEAKKDFPKENLCWVQKGSQVIRVEEEKKKGCVSKRKEHSLKNEDGY